MRIRRIVICGLSGSTVLFHIISYTTRPSKRKLQNTKCVFCYSLQLVYIGPHEKYSLFFLDFNETRIFSTTFLNILKYQTLYN